MGLQSWIINCLKISDEIINFIEKNRKTWRVELTAGGESLAETKIQKGIFQGDATIIITIYNCDDATQLHTQKMQSRTKFTKSQKKINHIMYMDDIKLFAKNEKELETLIHAVRIYSQDIRMEFGIEKCAMLILKSGKRDITDGM